MKIATWNINGVRARLGNFTQWLNESEPDIVCLQEIKTVDDQFPRAEIEALGYHVETHGQKGFNGVAILSKLPFDEVKRGLPGDDDEQARFIEGVFSTDKGALRVASLYLPNGNPVGNEKNSPTSSPGWTGSSTGGEPAGARRAAGACRRLQCHPRAERCDAFPRTGSTMRCSSRERGRLSAGSSISASPTPSAPSPMGAAYTSGTIRPAPGRRTTASASTI